MRRKNKKIDFWKDQMWNALAITYQAIGRQNPSEDATQAVAQSQKLFNATFPAREKSSGTQQS